MKKAVIFFLILTVFSFDLSAQKGTVLVGGFVTYLNQSSPPVNPGDPNNTGNGFVLNCQGGYQFTNNITAGVLFGLGLSTSRSGTEENKENAFAAGPFVRYTKTLSDLFAVYGEFQATFGSNKETSKNQFNTTERRSSFYEVAVIPALFVNIKKGLGLNFTFGGIVYNSSKPEDRSRTNVFGFN